MNGEFIIASVGEFLKIWGAGGICSLSLRSQGGMATVSLECCLGHPGGFLPQASSPPHTFTVPPPQHSPPHVRDNEEAQMAKRGREGW